MSITSTMFTGASGLNANSSAMSVVSDNIANVNTIGYKRGRANFADVLGGQLAGKPAGAGATTGRVQLSHTQGSLLGTGNTTDLAVRGEGFFLVNGTIDGVRADYYTRDGSFQIDKDGFVVNGDNLRVQGFPSDGNGGTLNSVGDLRLDLNSIAPNATNEVNIVANLDSEQAVSATAFDITDPNGTSDFSTSMTVYDSLGQGHQLEIYFKKSADVPTDQWDYHVVVGGDEITPPTGTPFTEIGQGTMTFTTDGSMQTYDLTSVNIPWAGADSETVALNFGNPIAAGGTGVDGVTNYALESATTFLSQDGFGSGDLAGLNIDETGTMLGLFSNGQQRVLGQVALARFSNNDGLERRGNGLFSATRESGSAVIGQGSSGGRGSIISGNLEASNVDLAQQFVEMIQLQRGFQSNSRSITTADEMLNEVLSLKR